MFTYGREENNKKCCFGDAYMVKCGGFCIPGPYKIEIAFSLKNKNKEYDDHYFNSCGADMLLALF
jgi:hypothetical protein